MLKKGQGYSLELDVSYANFQDVRCIIVSQSSGHLSVFPHNFPSTGSLRFWVPNSGQGLFKSKHCRYSYLCGSMSC